LWGVWVEATHLLRHCWLEGVEQKVYHDLNQEDSGKKEVSYVIKSFLSPQDISHFSLSFQRTCFANILRHTYALQLQRQNLVELSSDRRAQGCSLQNKQPPQRCFWFEFSIYNFFFFFIIKTSRGSLRLMRAIDESNFCGDTFVILFLDPRAPHWTKAGP